MDLKKLTEYIFFFGLLILMGYMVWLILFPFVAALILATIIVLLCYPFYNFILYYTPRQNRSVAALLATVTVFFAIVIPTYLISNLLVNEFASFYAALESSQELPIDRVFVDIETALQRYIPDFEFSVSEQIRQSAGWFVGNLGKIFAGTISVIFLFFIALLGSFYLFRDGSRFTRWLIEVSPLPDDQDTVILDRVTRSIRSVATGTVLLSVVQGVTAAMGFSLFGIERAILWGSLGALGSLLPGIGTIAIMTPAIAYLVFAGNIMGAIGLFVWAICAIAIIDNLLGPHLMSRGNNLHPFVILLSVLGGISVFGPIGFMIGPVVVSLFVVLLEIYMQNIAKHDTKSRKIKRT